MNKVEIYQIKDVHATPYGFMSYDYAKGKININDYRLVANLNTNTSDLEEIYIKGNNGELQRNFQMRSISVSDIIKMNSTYYYVDSFGFKELADDEINN